MTDTPPLKLAQVIEFDCLKTYPDVLEVIQKLLAMAENGEVIGLAAVALNKDRTVATVLTDGMTDNVFKALGAVEYLSSRLVDAIRNS